MIEQELSNAQYHADREYVSKTWLDKINRSPAHLKAYLDGFSSFQSPAMALGSLVHEAVLEPELFENKYCIEPEGIRRPTKAQLGAKKPAPKTIELIDFWSNWDAQHQGMIPISADDHEKAVMIRDSVYSNSAAKELLSGGQAEVSAFYEDAETGVKCKARADYLISGAVVDLKTTKDARESEFARSCANFRYHVQAAHYCEAFEVEDFYFIAVETDYPFAVNVFKTSRPMLNKGYDDRLRNLKSYKHCIEENIWTFGDGEVGLLDLPAWVK